MASQSSAAVKLNDFNNGSSLHSCVQSSVEAGSLKTVTITFHPPRDSSIHTLEASTNVSANQSSFFSLFYGTKWMCLVSTIVLATILIANRVKKCTVLKSMKKRLGLSESFVILWASTVEGSLFSGVPL